MIKINLIPPEYIARIDRRAVIAKAVLAGVLVAASVAGVPPGISAAPRAWNPLWPSAPRIWPCCSRTLTA